MKIKWFVEGVGDYTGSLPGRELVIPDEDIENMTKKQKQEYIDSLVQQEFNNNCYPFWEED